MLKLALIAAVADLFFGTGAGDVAVGFLPVIIGIGAGLSAAGFGAAAGTIALAGAAGALGGSYLQGQQRDAEKAAQRERDRLAAAGDRAERQGGGAGRVGREWRGEWAGCRTGRRRWRQRPDEQQRLRKGDVGLMAFTPHQVHERFQKAVNLRSEYDSFFREVARHFLPRHQDFWHEQTSRGRNRAGHLYDNAGIQARRKAVDLITSGVFPKGKEWVKLAISREVYEQISPDERQQVDIYLAQWSRVVQSFLNASNFRDVMKACAADWLTFGYCAVMPMSVAHTRKMGLGFWLAPANTIWLAQASDSAWNGAFWRRNMTPDDFKREFPNYPLNEQSISQTEEFPVVYGFLPGVGYNQEFAFLEREMGASSSTTAKFPSTSGRSSRRHSAWPAAKLTAWGWPGNC